MNRRLTAAFAALEALLVVGIGIGLPLAVLTLMWALQFGFQLDWLVFWRAAVDVWLIGHGVDVRIALDPAAGAELGLALEPFPVTLALLGGAVLTAGAGVVLGGRLREQPHRGLGAGIAVAGVVGLSWLATTSAGHPVAQPDLQQGTVFPAAVFALGLLVGLLMAEARSIARGPGATGAPARSAPVGGRLAAARAALDATAAAARRRTERGAQSVRDRLDDLPRGLLGALAAGWRAGLGAVLSVVVAASVLTTAALVVSYGQVIALYESVQAEVLGGVALTLGQLLLLPTAVLWSFSWLVGPGFALGTGSSVSALGTTVGPLPAIPLLGAVPAAGEGPGFIVLLVPVLLAFIAGLAVRPRLVAELPAGAAWRRWALAAAVLAAVIAGLLAGGLAAIAAGSAGPGRLEQIGPDGMAVGLWMLAEAFVGVLLGLLAGGVRVPFAGRGEHPGTETEGRSGASASTVAGSPPASSKNGSARGADRPAGALAGRRGDRAPFRMPDRPAPLAPAAPAPTSSSPASSPASPAAPAHPRTEPPRDR